MNVDLDPLCRYNQSLPCHTSCLTVPHFSEGVGQETVPGLLDLPVGCTCASFRPGSRDNAPALGLAAPGVVAATGHYRHGILLTPVTAQEIARYVRTGTLSDWIEPFQPARFDTVSSDVAQT
jgi:glycine oxidase (EC 1.4.3.19)